MINFKICDNAKECRGIAVCPTKALYWDKERESIGIDNSKCTNCRLCEKSCDIGAIKVAKTDNEYSILKKEIDDDSRKVSDLFVDRYGAMPIDPGVFFIKENDFELEVLQSNKLTVLEAFNDDSIECLIKSIPIKNLFKDANVKYRKIKADNKFLKRYNINKLPSLLFFTKGELIGKIEGYFSKNNQEELIKKINKIKKL